MKFKIIILTLALFCASCGPRIALKNFKDLPKDISIETIGNRVAEQLLASNPLNYGKDLPGYQAPYTYGGGNEMNYAVISLWVNAIEFAHKTHNKELENRLIDFFEPFFGEKKSKCNRDNHVDFSIFGAIPLEIYLMNGDKRALEMGLRYADHQWEDPTGNPGERVGGNGNFPIERQREFLADGYSPQTRLWIDDMYMITVLQAQAYRATRDRKYIDRAAREMKMYMDSLQRDNGLFYHAAEGPFFWGRGNGWMAAGLPMLLKYLPKENEYRPALMEAYLKMMATLLEHQHENGMWGQVIDDLEFWEESSCSAMFAYAFIEGVRQGWLDEATYGDAARRAWAPLCGLLDEHANIAEVCIGTNWGKTREYYMARPRANGDPHGQMAMMWICSALLKN
jgi:rhamnogalacturonyl hydrolase YesR